MNLAADVLDKQLRDRSDRPCGKVDGIVLALDDDGARVVALEVGCVTLAARLGRRPARWARWLVRRLRRPLVGHWRIPWDRVVHIGRDVHVDVDGERGPLGRSERWLRERVVARIPGA
jgi:hypothetical protein